MYVLQDVWINMIIHKNKERAGYDVPPVSIDWKNQDHIIREQDEAIAAFYKLGLPMDDIATIVGIGNKTVLTWKENNR